MELRRLKYFLSVVENGGFTEAAATLPVKQRTLMSQVRQLEKEMGLRLIHRRAGETLLTEAGRIFARHAKDILGSAERARRAMEDLKYGSDFGEIRIGTVDSVGIYFLPQVLISLQKKHPGLRLSVLYRNSDEILQALLADEIDVALVDNPRTHRNLKMETLIEEQVSLVCARRHPLFERKYIRPKDIEGLRVIALSAESATGRLVQGYLSQLGVGIEPVASAEDLQTAKKMVEVGLGVTFLPDMITSPDISCKGESLGSLARVKLNPSCNRRIVLATWKQSKACRSMGTFVEETRKYSSQWRACSDSRVVA